MSTTDRARSGWFNWIQILTMAITCAVNVGVVGFVYGKMSAKDIELESRITKAEAWEEAKDHDIQEIKISTARIEEKVEMLLGERRPRS